MRILALTGGRFTGPLWDWLDLPEQSELCPLQFSVGVMGDVIATLPDAAYDFVHLSNILDWVRPSEAEKLLNQVHRCLAPGGLVVIRQSSLIGAAVVKRGWLSANGLVHYNLHKEIDKQQGADFFDSIRPAWQPGHGRLEISQGLRLGAYAFDSLYRNLSDC